MATESIPTDRADLLKRMSIARAREAYPEDTEGVSDDDVWAGIYLQPVTIQLLTTTVGSITEVVEDLERRIQMLENAQKEPPSVARLRELARNAMALEEVTIGGQDADAIMAYIDRLRGK